MGLAAQAVVNAGSVDNWRKEIAHRGFPSGGRQDKDSEGCGNGLEHFRLRIRKSWDRKQNEAA
jgi:hypothetical protein